MDEYISREATIKAFCEKCKGYYDGHCVHQGECDVDVIQTVPSADVQPVCHGRWIGINEYCKKNGCIPSGIGIYFWCSECEKAEPKISDYCPNCGARMDGDAE